VENASNEQRRRFADSPLSHLNWMMAPARFAHEASFQFHAVQLLYGLEEGVLRDPVDAQPASLAACKTSLSM
jgi:hypothetical protein